MTAIDPNTIKELEEKIEKRIEEKILKKMEKMMQSIQISILKENFLTRDEFLKAMEKIDERFNAMQKQMDDRFNAMQKQMDDRFNAMQKQMDDRFNAMQRQIDKRFERVNERFDQLIIGNTNIAEGIAYSIIKREFKIRGYDLKPKMRHHFTDPENYVFPDTTDVEIDIFQVNPNFLAEATYKLLDIEKIRTFIRKIQFIEKMYKEPFKRFFICLHIDESIENTVNLLFKEYNIELIVPEYED
ncbi:MAG: hypothetical protein ACTSVV_16470 [Promethearchaeota archaeon]